MLVKQRQFCRAQCKEKEEKVDRRSYGNEDNIKEWTGVDCASSTRAAADRTMWKGVNVRSSVVPQRPYKVMG